MLALLGVFVAATGFVQYAGRFVGAHGERFGRIQRICLLRRSIRRDHIVRALGQAPSDGTRDQPASFRSPTVDPAVVLWGLVMTIGHLVGGRAARRLDARGNARVA